MKLFNKFNETIFLKQHNELEKQIEVLKKLDQQYPNKAQRL